MSCGNKVDSLDTQREGAMFQEMGGRTTQTGQESTNKQTRAGMGTLSRPDSLEQKVRVGED